MFEHLDDPRTFPIDDQLRHAVTRRGQQLRRRARLRTVGLSLGIAIALIAVATGGYARWQVSRIDRVSIAAIPQVDPEGNPVAPNVGAVDKPFTLLVIGNDDAPGVDGRSETNLADSIMLLRIDRTAGAVRVVSIPRDTLVAQEDGSEDRINATRREGIPALITAINRNFGITVDHYAEAHFSGFARFIDAIGGVPLQVDLPVRDTHTGLDLDAGCHVLDGEQALALVRSRYLEVHTPEGTWKDPRSDLGRVERQQVLAVAAAKQAARISITGSLANLDTLIGTDPTQITLDDHLTIIDLLQLGAWVGSLPDDAITAATPGVHPVVTSSGASVLALDDGEADALRSFLLGEAVPPGATVAPDVPVGPGGASTGVVTDVLDPIRLPDGGTCP